MYRTLSHRFLPLGLLLIALLAGFVHADADTSLQALLERVPAETATEGDAISADLLAVGSQGVRGICDLITPMGDGDDTKPRYALSGLATYVARPQSSRAHRAAFAEGVAEALADAPDPQVAAFLVFQLQVAAISDSIDVLAPLLADVRLAGPATRALQAIGSRKARAALRNALEQAEPADAEPLILALGDLRDGKAAEAIAGLAENDATCRAARWALANIGHRPSQELLRHATETDDPLEQSRAAADYLLFARRIGDGWRKGRAADICREILKRDWAQDTQHIQAEALASLVSILGKRAMPDLLAALDSDAPELRRAALAQADHIAGRRATRQWVRRLEDADPAVRAEIIRMLGARGHGAAEKAVTGALTDENQEVRLAAIPALGQLLGPDAVPALIGVCQTEDRTDIAAVKAVLGTLVRDTTAAPLADALAATPPLGRVALIETLALRRATDHAETIFEQTRADDPKVRTAALKAMSLVGDETFVPRIVRALLVAEKKAEIKAAQNTIAALAVRIPDPEERAFDLVQALGNAPKAARPRLIAVLPRLGGADALQAADAHSLHVDAATQDIAIRALADWPDATASDAQVRIAKDEEATLAHRVLALRGYVRLTADPALAPEERLRRSKVALFLALRPEERQRVVAGMGDIRIMPTLEVLAELLRDEELKREAALAGLRNAFPENAEDEWLGDDMKKMALRMILTYVDDQQISDLAAPHLKALGMDAESISTPEAAVPAQNIKALPPDTEGFVPLFNGVDLTGWTGSVDGYFVQDGAIVCDPKTGGLLMTEKDYGNFVLRLEFKLTPGANNGIGIRAPLGANPAYEGMELQVLDNTAAKYAGLQPYQFHGSIYGVAPAKRGFLRPVGEWNEQEIIAHGNHIVVRLNGEVIVDADIAGPAKNGTMDGKPHPGLSSPTGRICFMGHGDHVEYRNIRVRELSETPPAPPEGFIALFNGVDLTGWKGLAGKGGSPLSRAAMTPEERAQDQERADAEMRAHWSIADSTLVFDGGGHSLCTVNDYGDFEMLVDWKIGPGGDSGIYLRGSPQVQIWDPAQRPEGSGGLFNNQKNPSKPNVCADNPIGEWNTFRIKMVGERVTVHLNDTLVVDNVVMENYWDRNQPIFPTGQIELQSHGSQLFFRNVFLREISAE